MKKRAALICFVVALFLSGCEVRSLRPLVSDEDAVFEPTLLGIWAAKGDNQGLTMKFTKSGERSYEMTLTTAKGATHFDARLTRLGSCLFLDLSPRLEQVDAEDASTYVYYSHLIPTHSFSKINVEKSRLALSSLSYDSLKNLITQGQLDIGCELIDDDVILTAGTPDLQRFLIEHADDTNLFATADELNRQE